MAVARETSSEPETVLDRGLRDEEVLAGLATNSDLKRLIISDHHKRIAEAVAHALGQDGRCRRSKLAAYGKYARRAGMELDDYLAERASEASMTVEEFLMQPAK